MHAQLVRQHIRLQRLKFQHWCSQRQPVSQLCDRLSRRDSRLGNLFVCARENETKNTIFDFFSRRRTLSHFNRIRATEYNKIRVINTQKLFI